MATFAHRLKSLRQETGYLQKEIAAKLSISRSTLGSWESGNRVPELGTAQKLADFFGVSIDYLLGRTDIKTEKLSPEPAEEKKPKELLKFLEQEDYTLNGRMATPEDRERLIKMYEAMYWDAKRQNKRK